MKRLSFFFVAFLLCAQLLPAQSLTFQFKTPEEGLSREVKSSMMLFFTISVDAEGQNQGFDVVQEQREQYDETVLAAEGMKITKREVRFTEAYEKASEPMRSPKEVNHPVLETSYVLESLPAEKEGEVKWNITRSDGAEAKKEEIDYLVKKFKTNIESPLVSVLDGRTMEVGETLELRDELLEEFGKGLGEDNLAVKSASITLVGTGDQNGMETGTFTFEAVLTGGRGMMEMEIAMKGDMEVGVETLWPVALNMKGTVVGAGAHAGASLSADGVMEGSKTAVYR